MLRVTSVQPLNSYRLSVAFDDDIERNVAPLAGPACHATQPSFLRCRKTRVALSRASS